MSTWLPCVVLWLPKCKCASPIPTSCCPEAEIYSQGVVSVEQLEQVLRVANAVISGVVLGPAEADDNTGRRLAQVMVKDDRVSACGAVFAQLLTLSSQLPFVHATAFYNPLVSHILATPSDRVKWLVDSQCDDKFGLTGMCGVGNASYTAALELTRNRRGHTRRVMPTPSNAAPAVPAVAGVV